MNLNNFMKSARPIEIHWHEWPGLISEIYMRHGKKMETDFSPNSMIPGYGFGS